MPNRTSSFHFLFQTAASSLMPAMTGDCDRMMQPPSCFKLDESRPGPSSSRARGSATGGS